MKINRRLQTTACVLLLVFSQAMAQTNGLSLTLNEYVGIAASKDTEFESILIDELELQYEKKLRLPARDIVMEARNEYVSFIDQDRDDADTSISLNKLFPLSGTELSTSYNLQHAATEDSEPSSGLSFSLTQPIARNAFGRSTRLLDKIVGIEIEVAKHQIAEAYEDYLATTIIAYYQWWAAYENLKIGKSSYRENSRLLDNMLKRQKQQIALPIDINKTRIQLLEKQASLIELENAYSNSLYIIKQSIRNYGTDTLLPVKNDPIQIKNLSFKETYSNICKESRTFSILSLLEKSSELNVDRQADNLLPSIDLLVSFEVEGENANLKNSENLLATGLAIQWPFPDDKNRASHDLAALGARRSRLKTANTAAELYTRLKNLYLRLEKERQLKKIANRKLELANKVLVEERENYSFGKVSLNDYIQAVNVVDNNRFALLRHDLQQKILTVEWLRLTDQLISKESIPGSGIKQN